MARVKRGVMTHKRHKKIIDQAKGYWGGRRRLFKTAKEAVMHAGQYAWRDRRTRKRDFRRLWITRISAACAFSKWACKPVRVMVVCPACSVLRPTEAISHGRLVIASCRTSGRARRTNRLHQL